MAETESQSLKSGAVSSSRPGLRRKFYVAISVVMVAMIFIGFWPSYYGPLVSGSTNASWILHLHGAVYIGWMFLLVAQAMLAARGDIKLHRTVGNFGIALGTLVFILGLIVSFAAPVMTYNAGTRTLDEAAGFLLVPLGDMVLFGSLFFSAVAYRTKPELHKRLMILATIAIAFAAIFRMQAIGLPLSAGVVLWFALPVVGMAYDFRTRGNIHPVYWIGIVAMGIAALRLPFSATGTWIDIARPIIAALA